MKPTPARRRIALAGAAYCQRWRTDEGNDVTAAAMNCELHARYTDALRQLADVWHPLDGDSKPMLIEVPPAYAAASFKLMVVGQEAGGWAKSVSLDEGAVSTLMKLYTDFDLGENQRPFTPFWQGAQRIAGDLCAASGRKSYLWSNLVKVDIGGRRPPAAVEAAVASLKLVEHELTVTRPDAVIFFTGPKYDDRLKATCPGAAMEELGNGTARSHGLPFRAVRTYHPKYLLMKRQWAELGKAVALLADA